MHSKTENVFLLFRMFSMKTLNGVGEVWPHKTSLIPPHLIKMAVSSRERERSCICVLEVSILPLSSDFSIGFWNCFDNVEFCFVLFFICLLFIFLSLIIFTNSSICKVNVTQMCKLYSYIDDRINSIM